MVLGLCVVRAQPRHWWSVTSRGANGSTGNGTQQEISLFGGFLSTDWFWTLLRLRGEVKRCAWKGGIERHIVRRALNCLMEVERQNGRLNGVEIVLVEGMCKMLKICELGCKKVGT